MTQDIPASRILGPKTEVQPIAYGMYLAIALGVLLAWRIGALYLSNTELFFDEAQYWSWSEELDFGYYSKPPLIAWLIRAATELCGGSEFCIRLPSPIVHAGTSIVIFWLGRKLFDARTGFWAALVYATLPGVAFSSGLISTDVPLLFFWALALLALVFMMQEQSWGAAIVLGLALGLGMLAKYAMIYFLICLALYGLWSGEWRRLIANPRIYAAVGIAALVMLPNVLWNLQNKFATLSHTADNAKWGGSMFNLSSALEFFASQTGVFGVILFGALLAASWRLRHGATSVQKLLICFSLPVIALITVQAFLSRAHANWAAVAYIAATLLVTAELLRANARPLFNASLGLHVAMVGILGISNAFAGKFVLPGGIDPYERVLGWRAIAQAAETKAIEGGFKAISTDKRAITAELLYYARGGIPVVAFLEDDAPDDHYELTRPLNSKTPEPILFVSFKDRSARLAEFFEGVELMETREIKSGPASARKVYFFKVTGYKARP